MEYFFQWRRHEAAAVILNLLNSDSCILDSDLRLSCLPVSFYPDLAAGRMTLADWFRTAARLGLDGADVSVAHVASRRPADLQRLAQQAGDAGVDVPMLVTYTDFTHPDPVYRAKQVDELRAWIEAADYLHVAFLRVTAGQAHPDVVEPDGIGWAIDGLTACLGEARAPGASPPLRAVRSGMSYCKT